MLFCVIPSRRQTVRTTGTRRQIRKKKTMEVKMSQTKKQIELIILND